MPFTFSTYVTVSPEMIRAIGMNIASNFEEIVCRYQGIDHEQYEFMRSCLRVAIDKSVAKESPNVEGYQLDSKEVEAIALELRNNKKIEGLKLFRMFTGEELKPANDFISQFGLGESAYVNFKLAFRS